ncbi:MAG: hypothetical protein ACKVP5_11350 [Aestuariivirga sp.]
MNLGGKPTLMVGIRRLNPLPVFSALTVASVLFVTILSFDWFTNTRPQTCYNSWYENEFMDKLAAIALREAARKRVDLDKYPGFIAVPYESRSDRSRKIIGLRFSTFRCDERGFDGGGFDLEIDPNTLDVIDSYFSAL